MPEGWLSIVSASRIGPPAGGKQSLSERISKNSKQWGDKDYCPKHADEIERWLGTPYPKPSNRS